MLEFALPFFSSEGFIPHGYCLTWRPDVFWTQVISDAIIALSYFSIPCVLVFYYYRQDKIRFGWLLILFGLFIVLCGVTHIFDIWTLWFPDYGAQALVKAATALVSLATTIILLLIVPTALSMPTHHDLEMKNAQLLEESCKRTQTEAALRKSQSHLKAITDSLFEGVLVVDTSGTITFANPSAKRLFNCDPSVVSLEGLPLDDIVHLDCSSEKPWARSARENVIVRQDDTRILTPQQQAIAVAVACAPLEDEQKGVVISFRDIEALKQAQNEAILASRFASVGQLAAGIAHEINTPVQYIGDNLHFIETVVTDLTEAIQAARHLSKKAISHPETADAAGQFEQMYNASDLDSVIQEAPTAIKESLDGVAQISRIVLSMKEFSHPGNSTKTTTDINRALETTLTVSHNRWKNLATVEKNFDPGLPSIPCHAGEMNQVFLNLIINAAQAIETSGLPLPGRISISTCRKGDSIEIRVADSGRGIPEAIKDRIFDPFFTTKAIGKGTGQGLAICRDVVVSKHGGSIVVASKEGEGAEFIIRLPIAETL